jgi:hypothetical protein
MMRLAMVLVLAAGLLGPFDLQAERSQDFGDFVVHYNALNTNLIPPEVARGYGIRRSSSRALLNVTVLKKVMNNPGTPVKARVKAEGTNLIGQRSTIEIREILDPEGAVYYIGEFTVHNMETFRFDVEVLPNGESEPLLVKFKQQFYTE